MGEGVIAALITGACSIMAIIVSGFAQSASTRKLMEYQITEVKGDISRLDEKVDKHNHLIERMAIVEESVKSAHKRIDEVKGEH